MNKPLLKSITDFGPLLVFLFFYYNSDKDLKIAIPPFIIATIVALAVVWILEKKNTYDSINWWYFYYTIWRFNNLF